MSASSRLSLASPARSCPFDVLGITFLYLRDSESLDAQYLEAITQVCRSWRTAALANRRLWSRILIDLQGYPDHEGYSLHKSRLRRYLERSVAAPLSVEITLKTDDWPPHNKKSMNRIKRLIALVSKELSRWESLSIDFEEEGGVDKWTRRAWRDEPITPLESFLRSPMPSLRRLSLCRVDECFEDLLPHVPLLNAFETKGGGDSEMNIPWSSLTSLRYASNRSSSASDLLEQLSQCIHLKDLYIEGIEPDVNELQPAFDCTLPHVVSFHLDCLPSREPINNIMAKFRLPSLQNLTLVVPNAFWDRTEDSSERPHMVMAEMSTAEHIVGFAGTCKTLTLRWSKNIPYEQWGEVSAGYATSRSVIFDMFNAMPDLEELCLSEEIFEVFLKVIKEEEAVVPKLSRVFILDTGGVNDLLTVDGLASRWQRGENWKTEEVPSRDCLRSKRDYSSED